MRGSLNRALDQELLSIMLFADTVPVLTQLKATGFKLGICSELGRAVLPGPLSNCCRLQWTYGWSFAVGTAK